ncbi:MAG TPA: protoporphyrinogen oxidase, partial [Thermoanaerobaculia bacterium]|nr:protoporphyrinogen oxidase [Thermoanaerobaculia bacterium]
PQYELGHGRFVALADEIERELPGLHLAGSYRDGVSLPDRLEAGTAVAAAILGEEAERRPARRAAAPEA